MNGRGCCFEPLKDSLQGKTNAPTCTPNKETAFGRNPTPARRLQIRRIRPSYFTSDAIPRDDGEQMIRTAVRKPKVLAATGWSNSTLYANIAKGKFPKGTRLDPDGRIVVWFEDEIAAYQRAAIERQTAA
jgi:prophage regulatory protein